MEISITNFKGISSLKDFHLHAINVLAGANSGGKSSLIHLILMVKQSLGARSQDTPLKLNKPYVSLGRFESIIGKQSSIDEFSIDFMLDLHDVVPRLRILLLRYWRTTQGQSSNVSNGMRGVRVSVSFRKPGNKIVISRFKVTIESEKPLELSLTRAKNGKSYLLQSNAKSFFFGRPFEHPTSLGTIEVNCSVIFQSFFPDYIDFPDDEADEDFLGGYLSSEVIALIRTSFTKFFGRISYLGPLREEPREYYYQEDDFVDDIGNKGENAAYILAKHSEDKIKYRRIDRGEGDGEAKIIEVTGTLLDAVNYWLCDEFGLAKSVIVKHPKASGNIYTVGLKNNNNITIPITHVGFGISQVFPILVEGLRSPDSPRLIILEQPEIHLHPRVQALLFDFVNCADPKISFLIETHSDHFINRIRRRIAECGDDSLAKKVNLTFVNRIDSNVRYEPLSISEIGTFDYWPEGFFDQYDNDLRALVKAQSKKRKNRLQNA